MRARIFQTILFSVLPPLTCTDLLPLLVDWWDTATHLIRLKCVFLDLAMVYTLRLMAIACLIRSICAGSHHSTTGRTSEVKIQGIWKQLNYTSSGMHKVGVNPNMVSNLKFDVTTIKTLNGTLDLVESDSPEESANVMHFISILSLSLNLALLSVLNWNRLFQQGAWSSESAGAITWPWSDHDGLLLNGTKVRAMFRIERRFTWRFTATSCVVLLY